jgi:hypothetical protein
LLFGGTLDGPFNRLRSTAILSTGNSLGVHHDLDLHLIGLLDEYFVVTNNNIFSLFCQQFFIIYFLSAWYWCMSTHSAPGGGGRGTQG